MNLEKIYQTVLGSLKVSVSEGNYSAYLKQTNLLSVTPMGERMLCEIGCTNAFIKKTVEDRFWGQITQELSAVLKTPCEIIFKLDTPKEVVAENVNLGPLFFENKLDAETFKKAKLKTEYSFDNYAVGGSNQMAHAAAQAVAHKLGTAYNPLFIYGGVGVGKTHLMQAVGHAVLEKGETRVLFCTGEEFTNDLVEGIKNKSTEKVRSKYRRLKLLMIDDIQFIAGRAAVQEEFFHTFNALLSEGAQIIMTSDRPPSEISKLEDRLKSRFGAGMIVDVGPADFELRAAVLLIKSRQRGFDLPIELAKIIAENVTGLREIEGVLVRLTSTIEMTHVALNEELIYKTLNLTRSSSTAGKIVTPNEAINLISHYFGVGVSQLKGDRRTKQIVWPRQVLMHMLRTELELPLEEVGRLIGGRDHSTVMHAVDKVTVELATNQAFKNQFEDLKRKLLTIGG